MRHCIWVLLFLLFLSESCRSTRELNKVIAPPDTSAVIVNKSMEDSIRMVDSTMSVFRSRRIEFNTFSAKVKVDAEAGNQKQPDLSVIIRIVRDSAIWMSVSSSILNIEVYRVLIKRDTVILMNKQEKEVQFRSLDYLQEVTGIPFDYKTLEDLLVGNPVFYSDSVISFQRQDKYTLVSTRSEIFKNLFTLENATGLLVQSKLDDLDVNRHRTANITYGDYENKSGFYFPVSRQIIAAEKKNIDVRMSYRQYEFNKELSVSLQIPRNYKRK